MTRDRLVFLSDVHIGVNARTNWYQARYHEAMLRTVFDTIIAEADRVAELVILGDFVDQWTYVPSERPPTFAQIAAANPGIFGAEGALARALTALDGRVSYVGGNHDMAVGAAELAQIRDPQGRSPRRITDFPYLPLLGENRIACAHGHQFSMFNAPDFQAMPKTGLPLGHVVTRLAALWSAQRLAAGETVADRPGAGEPTGWAFEKDELATLLVGVVERKASIAELVVGALLRATGQPDSIPIVLPDGSTITPAQAMKAYDNLYSRFKEPARYPASALTSEAAFFALTEVDTRNSLGHFARLLGKQHRVVVMGHTHVSDDETQRPLLFGADNIYANCGFNCPAQPDVTRRQHPRLPTFVEVQVNSPSKQLVVCVRAVELAAGTPRVATDPLHSVTIAY
jgi:UDP-2,3-diacylglucosamine pyrophosphatase LpxH